MVQMTDPDPKQFISTFAGDPTATLQRVVPIHIRLQNCERILQNLTV
jgi:hypothetical protein